MRGNKAGKVKGFEKKEVEGHRIFEKRGGGASNFEKKRRGGKNF